MPNNVIFVTIIYYSKLSAIHPSDVTVE